MTTIAPRKSLKRFECGLIADAIRSNSTAIVIATAHQLDRGRLELGLDLDSSRKRGQHLAVDANETLSKLLIDERALSQR
jgi:hypothetical protein